MAQTILVADDNLTVQRVAAEMLSQEGLAVVTVANGMAAIKKIPTLKPLVVLADVDMPGKDGYEVCEFVKAHPDLAHVRVLLAVSDTDPYDPERGERARADGVIKKPFDRQELASLMAKAIEQAQALCPSSPAVEEPVATQPSETALVSDAAPEAPPIPEAPASAADLTSSAIVRAEDEFDSGWDAGVPGQPPEENAVLDAAYPAPETDSGDESNDSSDADSLNLPDVATKDELQAQHSVAEDSAAPATLVTPIDSNPPDFSSCEPVSLIPFSPETPVSVAEESSAEISSGTLAAVEVLPEETLVQEPRAEEDLEPTVFEPTVCQAPAAPESEASPEISFADDLPAATISPSVAPLPETSSSAEPAAAVEAAENHAVMHEPSIDLSLVASVVYAVVKRIAPPAFSPEMVLDLECKLTDEILSELAADAPPALVDSCSAMSLGNTCKP
ncbi:MAG: response regulator [Terriglobia bacterium]